MITVLYGGNSPERAVSLNSGRAVAKALTARGKDVLCLDWQGGDFSERSLADMRASEAVFLCLHGGDGEGGVLQEKLEKAGIFHYTGSGPEASALAMNKATAREKIREAGLPVARGVTLHSKKEAETVCENLFPAVQKPLSGGSSIGVSFPRSREELINADVCYPVLLEEYLPGREFSVGILLDKVLPPVEILPKSGRYDYAAKYTSGATRELCPAPIPAALERQLKDMALRAHRALGLREVSRVDIRLSGEGVPHFLEANSLPGLTSVSLLPLAAKTAGIPFFTLCERLAEAAARRRK